jgi:mannosyl-oligosaccharide alpha-1,2-mannosidase
VLRAAAGAAPPAAAPVLSSEAKLDHLACFLPGHFALSSAVAPTRALRRRHLSLAKRLMRTCMRLYAATASGLAAEIYRVAPGAPLGSGGGGGAPLNEDGGISPDVGARHSLLRPEAVESLFLLHRVTGDVVYREWGAQVVAALNRHARVASGGFTSVADVTLGGGAARAAVLSDNMESFFVAETLKYLLLLFGDAGTLPLDAWVFTTEAHPLRVWREDEAHFYGDGAIVKPLL